MLEEIKIQALSPEHSEKIQNYLFSRGCEWYGGGSKTPIYTNSRYLFVDSRKRITHSGFLDSNFFNDHPFTEVKLNEVIHLELEVIKKKNVVNVLGNSYYEEDVRNALKLIQKLN